MVNEVTKLNKDAIEKLAQAMVFITSSNYDAAGSFIASALEKVKILKETKDKEEW